MKKLFVLFFLPLLSFTLIDEWKTVRLDDHVSASFPSEPVSKDLNGLPGWISVPDTNSMFMVTILDMEKFDLDSAKLAPFLDQQDFYEQYQKGVMGQFGNVQAVYDTVFKKNGYHIFEFGLKNERTNSNIPYQNIVVHSIFIGSKVYAFSSMEKKPVAGNAQKFFGTFQFN
jgi:hypothetical protein